MPSNRNYGKVSRQPCCFMRFVATKAKHLIWQELKVQTTSSFWANCVLKVCRFVLWTSIRIAIETVLWMVVRFLGQPTMPMLAGHCMFMINVIRKNITFKILYNDSGLRMSLLSIAPYNIVINLHPFRLRTLIQYKL